jgi:peptidoglycan hydrolase CwlO-like protein
MKAPIVIVALVALITAPALAQQIPAPDPVAATYAQLLDEANGRVAQLSAQLQQVNMAKTNLEKQIADLQKQLDAAKSKPDASPTSMTPK